jgi:hypothetical protein
MSEVVNDDVRFGVLYVPRVKATGIPTVFSHEMARSLDLGIESCDLMRDWAHGGGLLHSLR